MKHKIMTGNEAVAYAVNLSRTQVISAYPITPQTTVMEKLADMWASGIYKGEYVTVESENSALAYCLGAAYAGARSFTATSSHGLAYMHELLHWTAGARLPIVLTDANRALGAPWCIESDQTDSLSQRDTGWAQFYCSSVQEIFDTVLLAFRLTEESRIPVMVVYDGFYLSHVYEAVSIPTQELVDSFLPAPPLIPAFDMNAPQNHHGLANAAMMSQLMHSRHLATCDVGEIYTQLNNDYALVMGRSYPAVEYLGPKDAKTIFIAAGAMAQTIHSFVAERTDGEALVRIKQFRPFPVKEIVAQLSHPRIRRVIVVDRNASMGVGGIFAQEVKAALYGAVHQPQLVELNVSGGQDLTPAVLIEALRRAALGKQTIWAVKL